MLEKQLQEAQLARRKRTIGFVLSVVAIVAFCGLVLIYASSCCSFNSNNVVDVEEELDTATLEQPEEPVSTVDDAAARQEYLQVLNDLQTRLEPALSVIDLERWQTRQASKLKTLKNDALAAFTATDYSLALVRIKQAVTLAEALLQESQAEFEQAMSTATIAYERDDYEQAIQQVDKALMLNKQSQAALNLKSNIDALAEILPLLQQAQVARTENNPEKELAALNEVLTLAPQRETGQQRKQLLITQISESQFKRYIDKTYTAIKQQDVATASKNIELARGIYPARGEIADAIQALEKLKQEQRFARHSADALAAMQTDDWQTASQQLSQALAERPNDKTINNLLDKSETILSLSAQLQQHLSNPYRLTNNEVKKDASRLLAESEPYLPASPALKDKSDKLTSLVKEMSRKVSVRVISDNKTNVLVRGVGIVGVTEDKTIELAPGQYKFEGKREGYKSKLIDVLIPYDKPQTRVTVICDEPI